MESDFKFQITPLYTTLNLVPKNRQSFSSMPHIPSAKWMNEIVICFTTCVGIKFVESYALVPE